MPTAPTRDRALRAALAGESEAHADAAHGERPPSRVTHGRMAGYFERLPNWRSQEPSSLMAPRRLNTRDEREHGFGR